MIIGFDGSRAFIGEKTGTENYSYQLLKALAKIDKKNKYIVYLNNDPAGLNAADLRGLIREGLTGKNFQFKMINWPRLWTQAGLALQTFKDKLDVLFVPAHTLPLIRKPGLKTVMTVHDLGSEYLPSLHQVKQRLYLSFIQRFQLTTANYLISVSNATKEDLVNRLGIDPGKVSVVYEGYDREKFPASPATRLDSVDPRRKRGKQVKSSVRDRTSSKFQTDILVNSLKQYGLESGKYFLFVGTVQPRKNLERLIKAFSYWLLAIGKNSKQRKANSEKLIIVGSKGWLSDEIYKLPGKLGVEERVKFLGYVPDKDLPDLYCGAIALTYPSLFEGFGLPIIEAQACGCPVITSNLSSMPEVAGKGAVYVNPYDIDDIVEGMRRVKESESQRVKLIKAGFENVKRFSWEKCAKETLEALEKTVG